MGVCLNPGMELFERAVHSDIYVDKTLLLSYLNAVINTQNQYLCVSRPRRFGKTMALNMICAYYDRTVNADTVFQSLKISGTEDYDKYRNQFDVIYLNMIDFLTGAGNVAQMLKNIQRIIGRELSKYYPEIDFFDKENLQIAMNEVFIETGHQFVIVIDEWDCIFRKFPEDFEGQHQYLDFLRDWIKDKRYVALAYMTGILPIKKYGEHSALNMFMEYSMTAPYQLAEYFGFTEIEVQELCVRYQRNFEEIKNWYDGYRLRYIEQIFEKNKDGKPQVKERYPVIQHLYSPLSVVNALTTGELKNYWNATETYTALCTQIDRNYEGLKERVIKLMGGAKDVVNIRKYQNDMTSFSSADDVMTLLVHLGYLGYDSETGEVFIPNKEIMDEYQNSIQGEQHWDKLWAVLEDSQAGIYEVSGTVSGEYCCCGN